MSIKHAWRPVLVAGLMMAGFATPAQAAELPDLKVAVEIPAGTWVPAEEFPIKVTVKNSGSVDATGVKADSWHVSGSRVFIPNSHEWGDLAPWGSGGTVKAGEERVVNLKGRYDANEGNGLMRFRLQGKQDDVNCQVPGLVETGLAGFQDCGDRVGHRV